MSDERINFLSHRWSRRAVLRAAALALAGSDRLATRAEEDPYTARYEAFLEDTYEGMQSPEGRVNVKHGIVEAGDIIYGYAQEIVSELDEIEVDLAREDFVLTAEESRLAGSGELNAEVDGPIDMSGGIEFHIELTSNSDGQLSLDNESLEIDGPLAFDLLDPEDAVKDKVGNDPNAIFVEYLNKAYQKRFGDEVQAGVARVFISDEFVEVEIARKDT